MDIREMTSKIESASKFFLQKKYDEVISLLGGENITEDPHALMILGESYRRTGDNEPAYKYLQEAYDKGNNDAACGLAIMYYYGIVVEKDVSTAYTLFKQAACCGNRMAMWLIAKFFCHDNFNGLDLETKNRPEEKMWRQLAQELPPKEELMEHAYNMIEGKYDCYCTKAEENETLQLAAAKGSAQAKSILANHYAKDLDDTESLKKSLYWFYSNNELTPLEKRKLKEVEERLGI